MPIRIGFVTCAHLHVWGYVRAMRSNPKFQVQGIWDDDRTRRDEFASKTGLATFESYSSMLESVDAVVIVSENIRHAEQGLAAVHMGKHVLCEKPLVTQLDLGSELVEAASKAGVVLMTAFPCPYSPAFERLKQRVDAGDIGELLAICSTNRGRCPFGWFVQKELSGGGAMIDHTVHVADLLCRLVGKPPLRVEAQIGNNMYGQDWEDTAMLSLEFPGGIFATLDSSWSRPKSYKTWGDVTMNVIGTKGVIELNMFNQQFDLYQDKGHTVVGYGSDLDGAVVNEFARAILEQGKPRTTGDDGLRASKIALAAYESARLSQPVSLKA